MFDCRITTIDRVIHNIFDRFLLQAYRLAGFLCQSAQWKKKNNSNDLAANVCLFIFHLAKRLYRLINKWRNKSIEFPLYHFHVQWIAISAFKLLWNKGPHKVRCRVVECDMINKYYTLLNEKILTNLFLDIKFPTKIDASFEKIKV